MKVLVVSPHPDDESIGCGGTLHRHVIEGDKVQVVFLTSGERGGHDTGPEETRRNREQEARAAAGILGLSGIEFWREPDGALRAGRRLAGKLAARIRDYRPDLVYVPGDQESHADHRAAARLVRAALKGMAPCPRVLMFEVWTPLPVMDEIIDITPYIETKLSAIRAYRSQCGVLRFDDASLGLARYRGEMFCWPKPGEDSGIYAEVFREQAP